VKKVKTVRTIVKESVGFQPGPLNYNGERRKKFMGGGRKSIAQKNGGGGED